MRGEFIGVWSETWREIWQPLIEEPFGENEEGVPEDIFCELYRELAKALKPFTAEAAVVVVIEDAVTLREIFEGAARRSADQELAGEMVEAAFKGSGATGAVAAQERRRLLEVALVTLVGKPAAPFLDEQLQEVVRDLSKVDSARQRAIERTINDRRNSREAFENTRSEDLAGERAVVRFFESVYDALEQFEESGDDKLTNRYYNLLDGFIEKFSLRYDLRRPCMLCPTLTGVFSSLVRELRVLTSQETHLDVLMKDFENAVRDLRLGCSDGRIKTCIQKQMNLLEAIGRQCPGVTGSTLGAICNEVGTWPHEKVKEAMKSLYGFASDYPGIRHGGTPASALRAIEMRDMVAMSILLAGFTPYLTDQLNAEAVYRGS